MIETIGKVPGQDIVFFPGLHWEEPPRWEQISLFVGDVTPGEEVSEQGKHKDKSPGCRLIFIRDKQRAGEGFPAFVFFFFTLLIINKQMTSHEELYPLKRVI